MCGIVAATAHRDVRDILISGLHALEYRGYDSAGIAMQRDGIAVGSQPSPRFVTARLEVDYLLPTPLAAMVLHGRLVEIKGRKVMVETDLSVAGTVTAKGLAVLVEIPEGLFGSGT